MSDDTKTLIAAMGPHSGFADADCQSVAEFLEGFHRDGADYHPATRFIDLDSVDWLAVGRAAMTDDALMMDYVRGDAAALDVLRGRYDVVLMRIATRCEVDGATEIIRKTWAQVEHQRDQYAGDRCPFKTWLFYIAFGLGLRLSNRASHR